MALEQTQPEATYPADLYRFERTATGVHGLDAVTDEQIAFFHEHGYLVVHDAFTPAEVRSALDGLHDLISGARPDYKGLSYEPAAPKNADSLPYEQKLDVIRKVWAFVEYDHRLKALSHHPKLLNRLERIIGEPPALFQDMALLKPPHIGREKPWHQDLSYFNMPHQTTVVGVWIALDPATPENGCMHVIPGSHRKGPVVHFQRRDWQICDTHMDPTDDLMVPLAPGGALFFHGLIQHGTPTNRSGQRRRAVQFHYKPQSAGSITREERMAVWGSEGKDVEC